MNINEKIPIKVEKYKLVPNQWSSLFTLVSTHMEDYPSFEQKNCRIVCDDTEKLSSTCMTIINAITELGEKTPVDVIEHLMKDESIKYLKNVTVVLKKRYNKNTTWRSYTTSPTSVTVTVRFDKIERIPVGCGNFTLLLDVADANRTDKYVTPSVPNGGNVSMCGCETPVNNYIYSPDYYITEFIVDGEMAKWLPKDRIGVLSQWRDYVIKQWNKFYHDVMTAPKPIYSTPNFIFATITPAMSVPSYGVYNDVDVNVELGFPTPDYPEDDQMVLGDFEFDEINVEEGQDAIITMNFKYGYEVDPPRFPAGFYWNTIEGLKNNTKAIIRVDKVMHDNYMCGCDGFYDDNDDTNAFYVFTIVDISIADYNGRKDVMHYNEINTVLRVDSELSLDNFIYKIYLGNKRSAMAKTITEIAPPEDNNDCGCIKG